MKVLIGLLTLWPVLYLVLFIGFFTASIALFAGSPNGGEFSDRTFMIVFALHLGTILFSFGLVAFYIVYLFRTDRVPQDKKALWAVVLFLGNMVAMPVFWYLYVWREPEKSVSAHTVPLN